MSELQCVRDTDNDGNCSMCASRNGCFLNMFKACAIKRPILSIEQRNRFKQTATPFTYMDQFGTVRGWRNKNNEVLVEEIEY